MNPGNAVYKLMDNYLDNFDEEHEFNAESIFEAVFFDRGDNNFNWGYTGDDQPNAQPQSTVRNQEYSPIAWRNLIPSNRLLNEFENTATGAAKTDPVSACRYTKPATNTTTTPIPSPTLRKMEIHLW